MSAPGLPYMAEPWFALLGRAAAGATRAAVAKRLGLSAATVSQVLNGSGLYGSGAAATDRIAQRVLDTFGAWPCPFLADRPAGGDVISAECCRSRAHREAPASSPRDVAYWRACQACPNRERSAPFEPRPFKARGAHPSRHHPPQEVTA